MPRNYVDFKCRYRMQIRSNSLIEFKIAGLMTFDILKCER